MKKITGLIVGIALSLTACGGVNAEYDDYDPICINNVTEMRVENYFCDQGIVGHSVVYVEDDDDYGIGHKVKKHKTIKAKPVRNASQKSTTTKAQKSGSWGSSNKSNTSTTRTSSSTSKTSSSKR